MAVQKHKEEVRLHERYNPASPLLRELISVFMYADDGARISILLTRVPSIGELISVAATCYRVTGIQHVPADIDGRTIAGYHAFVNSEVTEEPPIPGREKWPKPRRIRRAKRSVRKRA